MNKNKTFQIIFVVAMFWVIAFSNAFVLTPRIEEGTTQYLDESMLMAGEIYLLSRTINAGVSVLQETSISASPIGIGLSFPVGQVLDPINDATERISDMSVYSMGIIGAQRVAVELGSKIMSTTIACLLLTASVFVFFDDKRYCAFLLQASFLLFAVSITIPATAIAAEFIDRSYFTPQINQQLNSLDELKELSTEQISQEGKQSLLGLKHKQDGNNSWYDVTGYFNSLSDAVERYWSQIGQVSLSTTEAISYTVNNFGQILDSLTKLFALWLAKVLFQGLILPLIAYFFIRQCFTLVFCQDTKVAIGLYLERFLTSKTA